MCFRAAILEIKSEHKATSTMSYQHKNIHLGRIQLHQGCIAVSRHAYVHVGDM